MAEFKKTTNKVSFFRIAQAKYSALTAEEIISGAIYFVQDETVGRIYLDGKCYGEANLSKSVVDVTLESEGEHAGSIKVTYTTGDPTYIALPEGKVYTAGTGIAISETNEISALDEKIGVDLTVTQATGALPNKQTITKDMTLKEILVKMLQQEIQPKVTAQPAVSVSMTGAGSYEVGTKVTPKYTASLSAGSYTYGPATGITATSWSVTDGKVETPLTTASGSFPEVTVTEGMNYKITATAEYNAGAVAITNLGNKSNPEIKIEKGSKTASSSAITGYRAYFYGTKTEQVAAYDSAAVRALSPKSAVKTFKITIAAGTRQVVIAAPKSITLKSVINVGLSRGEVADTFNKTEVNVEGANGYEAATYNVWVYNSATALDTNTFEVTLA